MLLKSIKADRNNLLVGSSKYISVKVSRGIYHAPPYRCVSSELVWAFAVIYLSIITIHSSLHIGVIS